MKLLLTAALSILLWGCAGFQAPPPAGFAEYKGRLVYRAVNPGGVVYRVKTTDNEPYAELKFWREAMISRMKDAGYKVIDTTAISISGKQGALLEMAAPIGNLDYSYLAAIVPGKKKILIAEASGKVKDLQACRQQLVDAMKGISF
ncbi:hypothetical protein ACFL5V_01865 [Fibrobacterota bacterium]